MRKTENWICKIFIFLFKKSSCRQLCQALWGSQAAASFLARAVVGLFPGHLHRWQVLGTGTLTAVCRPSRAYGLATHITHPGGQMGFMDWGNWPISNLKNIPLYNIHNNFNSYTHIYCYSFIYIYVFYIFIRVLIQVLAPVYVRYVLKFNRGNSDIRVQFERIISISTQTCYIYGFISWRTCGHGVHDPRPSPLSCPLHPYNHPTVTSYFSIYGVALRH